MPYERKLEQTWQEQVKILEDKVAQLAKIKLGELHLKEASKVLEKCSAQIEAIYNNANADTKIKTADVVSQQNLPRGPSA